MKSTTPLDESEAEIVQNLAEQAEKNSQDHCRLVDLIGNLDLQTEWFTDNPESDNAYYGLESMAAACLNRFARGMSFTGVVDFLTTTDEKSQFDLPEIPTQQAISFAWRNRFDSTSRSVIRRAACQVRFAQEFH